MHSIQNKKWIKPPQYLKLNIPYIQATILKQIDTKHIQCEVNTVRGALRIEVPIEESYEVAQQEDYPDMCGMNVLNEPEVLNNIVKRYTNDNIFTSIGSTLIVVNPYRNIHQLFNHQLFSSIKHQILHNQIKQNYPHIYVLAGKAYLSMQITGTKQAIVISGQSGAGKTQSTKYCMRMLTSLNNNHEYLIQQKILACNPILEAFGNCKTVRNQNSSRFGKFVKIYFDNNNLIRGATIKSYLLEKSRVISLSKNERTFHCFYAVVASGKFNTLAPQNYSLLKQSQCYESSYTNDAKHFLQIISAFQKVGFQNHEIDNIWQLIIAILALVNIDFDQLDHLLEQSKPCSLIKCQDLSLIAKSLKLEDEALKKVLLFQRKRFLKETTLCAYNRQACINNRNTICKAIYKTVFDYILHKIQITLIPVNNQSQLKEINILDIFGFQNFQQNSFQQLCINYANEKLLRLYNHYVFYREIEILKEDGLENQVLGITPPDNQSILSTLNGKISIFSIINDMTLPQCRQEDMIQGFKKIDTLLLRINKKQRLTFSIQHSQCQVQYHIGGFKMKNQDKTNDDINQLISNLFTTNLKEQTGKTILNQFSKQIEDLTAELASSNVHFIRCIKPNDEKQPKSPNQRYILTQIRYLGIFQTIMVRKNIYPYRKTYKEFRKQLVLVFPNLKSVKSQRQWSKRMLRELCQNQTQYLLGNHRIYLNLRLQKLLNKRTYQFLKLVNESIKKIQKTVKIWIFKKKIFLNLKSLCNKIAIFKAIPHKMQIKLLSFSINIIKQYSLMKRHREIQEEEKVRFFKLKQGKRLREAEQQRILLQKKMKQLTNMEQFVRKLTKVFNSINSNTLNITISKLYQVCKENQLQNSYSDQLTMVINQQGIIQKIKENQLQLPMQEKQNNMSPLINKSDFTGKNNSKDHYSPYQKPQTPSHHITGKSLKFDSSFISILNKDPTMQNQIKDATCAFQDEIKLESGFLKNKNLGILQEILFKESKISIQGSEQDFFSPPSIHTKFIIQQLPQQILSLIIDFPLQFYFDKILRKRTNFIGYKKTYKDILVHKNGVLNKTMTVLQNQQDEKKALDIFKLLLKIGEQFKIQHVLKYVQQVIQECAETSNALRDQIFIQLIRQVNTNHQLTAIRIYQTMAVFLHIYSPSEDTLKATLSLLYWKYQQKKKRVTQCEYMTYLFSMIIQKLKQKTYVGYIPINYQIMGIMCKRQISVPVYLSIGNSIIISLQSFNTFSDIKHKAMKTFGINTNRFKQQYFTFFQVINFNNQQLQENPIKETNLVWDMITYWQITKSKYIQCNLKPPLFFLMLKIKYAFQCHEKDEEAIELYYAQLYFDYFMGKIKLDNQIAIYLGSLIRLIKFKDQPVKDIYFSLIPAWILHVMSKQNILETLQKYHSQLKLRDRTMRQLKYQFIKYCEQCNYALAMKIPTEEDSLYKLFMKNKKLILVDKNELVMHFSLKRMVKWKIEKDCFEFQVYNQESDKNEVYKIKTNYSSICMQFLKNIPLSKNKICVDPKIIKK